MPVPPSDSGSFYRDKKVFQGCRNLVKLGSYEVSEYIAHFIQH